MSLKEHRIGYAVGSMGWIIVTAYLILNFVQHGRIFALYSREALLEYVLIIGTIPIFTTIGYFVDRKITLERRLKEYSLQLEQKVEEKTKEITKTKDYLQRLIDASPIGIISTDLQGKILSFSRGAEEMYGYAAAEVLGRHASILQPKEVFKSLNKEMYHRVMKDEIVESELLNVRKNGEVFPIYLHCRSIVYDQGRPIGLLSLAQDITQRKKIEKLKDLFTDIIRHDLLNPLGVIRWVAELRLGEKLEEKEKKDMEMILKNAQKLIEVIENTSKLAKLESAEKLEFERIDLNATFREVIENFRPLLEERKIALEYTPKGECWVEASPLVEEVFSNLLSNAIKYSPEKGRIVVGIEDGGEAWKVMVKDYGEGIPDESKEVIFERFKRADKRGVKGIGLGLAIVKRIVEMHKGKVWVEDNPEGGSIFYATIPKFYNYAEEKT